MKRSIDDENNKFVPNKRSKDMTRQYINLQKILDFNGINLYSC